MQKVLFYSFLFIFFSCARDFKSEPVNDSTDSSNVVYQSIREKSMSPEETENIRLKIGKVKIYIENTLSMYGYLPYQGRGGQITGFRNTVNELVRASKNTYKKENVELSLINNTITKSINIDNNLDNIDESTLKNKYYKGSGSSDFDKLFKEVLKDWNEDEVLVLIADFIYSPKGRDPKTGLDNFRGEITSAFKNASDNKSLAVNILNFDSDFHGKYYDIDDKGHLGIDNRPYYIFIIGNENNVKEYSHSIAPKIKRYNLKNDYYLSPSDTEIDDYSALPFTLNIGQFGAKTSPARDSQVKGVTVKNSLNSGSKVQLAIAADLRDIPVSVEYLLDTDNYQLNNDKIKIKDIVLVKNKKLLLDDGTEESIKPGDIAKAGNASHAFLLSFPATHKGPIELSLKKTIPDWVNDVSIKDGEDDKDIETNVLKQSQTFGFNSIVEGIYDAQRIKNPKNEYFRITLDIDQEKSGSGIGAIIGWLIGLGIIGIIIFIVIRNKQRK